MDKRWIGIILILIMGIGCMYLIVSNSDSVGKAVAVISDVTITLPDGFITSEDGSHFCVLFNKKTNETLRITCLEKSTNYVDEYNSQLKSLSQKEDIIVGKHSINQTQSQIKYENLSSKDKKNIKLVFFDKCNHTFSIKVEHLDNEKKNEQTINYIIDLMKPDFKQNNS